METLGQTLSNKFSPSLTEILPEIPTGFSLRSLHIFTYHFSRATLGPGNFHCFISGNREGFGEFPRGTINLKHLENLQRSISIISLEVKDY